MSAEYICIHFVYLEIPESSSDELESAAVLDEDWTRINLHIFVALEMFWYLARPLLSSLFLRCQSAHRDESLALDCIRPS